MTKLGEGVRSQGTLPKCVYLRHLGRQMSSPLVQMVGMVMRNLIGSSKILQGCIKFPSTQGCILSIFIFLLHPLSKMIFKYSENFLFPPFFHLLPLIFPFFLNKLSYENIHPCFNLIFFPTNFFLFSSPKYSYPSPFPHFIFFSEA